MRIPLIWALLPFLSLTRVWGLHFYFESNEKRCFLEELPSDTIVEGEWSHTSLQSHLCMLVVEEARSLYLVRPL